MVQVFNINEDLFYGLLNLNVFAAQENLSIKRDIELKGRDFLIKQIVHEDCQIVYDDKGKPYLQGDSRHISISHSHDLLAIIVNKQEPIGIDIELKRDKVLKIKHKFLSDIELSDADNDIDKLLIYWSAKETLYKIYGLKEVDFINHLFIKPFTKHKLGQIIGEINLPSFNESFRLHYEMLDDYVLVYALNKIT